MREVEVRRNAAGLSEGAAALHAECQRSGDGFHFGCPTPPPHKLSSRCITGVQDSCFCVLIVKKTRPGSNLIRNREGICLVLKGIIRQPQPKKKEKRALLPVLEYDPTTFGLAIRALPLS